MASSWILAPLAALCLYQIAVSGDATVDEICEAGNIKTCDDCIQAHPKCAWCLEGEFDGNIKRCRSAEKLRSGGCKTGRLEDPEGNVTLPKNDDFSIVGQVSPGEPIVQLKPQKVHVDIRKGETRKFNITYRKVSDYPVDLYYVMDLSNSMKDDLETLQTLGQRLAEDIKSSVTQDIQLGFGTFVDKVMMPFASTVPAQLQNPCFKDKLENSCAPPFGFKHQQRISENLDAFRNAVTSTTISGNIDSPEGGFDALMQIAVCTSEIGWRDESTHLVVFTTDASFHMALDGKLAAILEMNDLQCHLERGANPYLPNDVVYSKSKEQDYPSIGQLRHVFNKYKIQPIFAVTKEVKPLYDGLRDLIPNSHVDQLANDSSNIIGIIKDAYNKLKGKLEMTLSDKPKEVLEVTHRVLCPGEKDWKSSLSCDNITINSEVIYEFAVTATQCPEGEIAPMTFSSSSLSESVEISLNFMCGCDCTDTPEPSSESCNSNGSLVCGVCDCDSQHEGSKCQCVRESENEALDEKCKKPGSEEICENNGECQCGNCECNDEFFGDFCQCSLKGCPKDENGDVCGGSEKGICRNCDNNLQCVCKEEDGWYLDTRRGTCTCNDKYCINEGASDSKNCSGHGVCGCGGCRCEESGHWTGKYCEQCVHPDCAEVTPTCEGTGDKNYIDCIMCSRKGKTKENPCDEECAGIEVRSVDYIPDCNNCQDDECAKYCDGVNMNVQITEQCQVPLPQTNCHVDYRIVWFKNKNNFGIMVKNYNEKDDCDEPINPIVIILPIAAGIVLIGLLLLAAWKIYQTIRDKKEWENFETEMKKSKWTKGQNPIFEKPLTKFQNPTYQGH